MDAHRKRLVWHELDKKNIILSIGKPFAHVKDYADLGVFGLRNTK
jgi:hypothetical protein